VWSKSSLLSSQLSDGDVATFHVSRCDMHVSFTGAHILRRRSAPKDGTWVCSTILLDSIENATYRSLLLSTTILLQKRDFFKAQMEC
jgi:hypothetical protein